MGMEELLFTNNDKLAKKISMIASESVKKYHHKVIGCNSRLDALQASILNIKLKYLDTYNLNRSKAAQIYMLMVYLKSKI